MIELIQPKLFKTIFRRHGETTRKPVLILRIKKITVRALALFLAAAFLFLSACSGSTHKGEDTGKLPTLVPGTPSPLKITEIMVKNKSTLADPDGNYTPWIELYNSSEGAVFLDSYGILYKDTLWTLPKQELAAGAYYLAFANGKGEADCAPFTLESSGTLLLTVDGKGAEQISYVNENDHHSFIVENGSESEYPTPGYLEIKSASSLTISEIMVTNKDFPVDGQLCSYLELYNSGSKELDLSEFFLSDSKENKYKYRFPAIRLAAGEYALIKNVFDMILPLSQKGGALMITRTDGVLCASTEYPAIEDGAVWTHENGVCYYPTPGYPNTPEDSMKAICDRPGLVVNEVLSSNSSFHKKNGEYYDMIELYNNSEHEISLADYCLSDSSGNLFKYDLPDRPIYPKSYFVIIAAGEGVKDPDANFAPFKLSKDGETLYITRKADKYISDVFKIPALPTDVSYGRKLDSLCYFETPTFGKTNGIGFTAISPTPTASLEGGFYSEKQTLTLLSEKGDIYYTLDNSAPTMTSPKYDGQPIEISKNTSIRMICIYDGRISSPVVTVNYFIKPLPLSLPIISVTVDEEEMYGKDGIYRNYNDDLEIPANAALYIDGKLEFSLNCGIKIFGAGSRSYEKKSYQLKFRSKYGPSKLEYDIFGDGEITEFNSLVLRSGSQDQFGSMIRDEFATTLAKMYFPSQIVQNNRPCNLYINGKYVGIYFIREKIGDDFIAAHYRVSPESVTIVKKMKSVECGDLIDEWMDIYSFACEKDLSLSENYKYICDNLCIDNLIDYYILTAWSDNRDTGNTRVFKSTEGDGKWRFIYYDMDLGFGTYDQNVSDPSTAKYLFGKYNIYSKRYNAMICNLFKNTTFRDLFLKRLNELCTTVFTDEIVLPIISRFEDALDNDMNYRVYGPTHRTWKNRHIPALKNYVTGRSALIVSEFVEFFGLSEADAAEYFPTFYPAT